MTRRRRLRPLSLLALLFAAVAAIASGCGIDHGLVGGTCAAGYTQCGARCVSLENDDQNCGGCGVVCTMGPCVEGTCRGSIDGAFADGSDGDGPSDDGAGDGALADAPGGDGSADDGNATDGAGLDGPIADGTSTDGAPIDGTLPDGAVTDGTTDDASDDASADADDDVQISCDGGFSPCKGRCVDLTADPVNCGVCGHFCASQICTPGGCAGTTPGDILLLGHDFQNTSAGTAQARVLTDAVFLAQESTLQVLSYEKYADPNAVARIHNIVTSSAPAGRTLMLTSTTDDADVATLNFFQFQVLIVADQVNAQGDVDLGALGASWAPALASFTQLGGIVVVLDGGTGAHQMPALVTATGLLAVNADAPIAVGTPLQVAAPGDALGVGVVSPYGAGFHSVSFATEPAAGNLVYVVVAPNDAGPAPPVVVHKVL